MILSGPPLHSRRRVLLVKPSTGLRSWSCLVDKHKEDDPQVTGSVSSMSTIKNPDCPKRSWLSNTSIIPITGSLKHQLNKSLGHWPSSPALNHIKKSNCQMHYWDTGKRKYSSVAYCKDCKFSLCTDKCYEVFHSMWDNGSQKENMKVEMEQKRQDTST